MVIVSPQMGAFLSPVVFLSSVRYNFIKDNF
nr:MAG TPA: hypothetical protein [Caudoviricetes sp.]